MERATGSLQGGPSNIDYELPHPDTQFISIPLGTVVLVRWERPTPSNMHVYIQTHSTAVWDENMALDLGIKQLWGEFLL